jgi:hypothetical protein
VQHPSGRDEQGQPGQTSDSVDDHVGDVEAAGRDHVLGDLQQQARCREDARRRPPPPPTRELCDVETEGHEQQQVGEQLERFAGARIAAGHERHELERTGERPRRADERRLELPQHAPDEQH